MQRFKKVSVLSSILTILLMAQTALAQNWTSSTYGYLPWTGLAVTADGKTIYAALTNGPLFFSTNSGATWSVNHWTNYYYTTGLSCAPNGKVVAAVTGHFSPGKIFVSTDYGVTWPATTAPLLDWTSISCSADGRKLVAAAMNGAVYISNDTGQTWTPHSPSGTKWVSVTSSGDGNQLAVASTNGTLAVSVDGGINWTTNNSPNSANVTYLAAQGIRPMLVNSAPQTNWSAVACSADKSRLVAVVGGGPIYYSGDAGSSWTASLAPIANWQAVACSADGTRMIAAIKNGAVYTSADAGATWVSNNIPNAVWVSVASSADGSQLAAAGLVQGAYHVYTSYSPPSPKLNFTAVSNLVNLSWTVPGTNFVLQQSLGMNPAGWMSLTDAPTLNLSNLQYQLSFSPTNASGFFRLSTP